MSFAAMIVGGRSWRVPSSILSGCALWLRSEYRIFRFFSRERPSVGLAAKVPRWRRHRIVNSVRRAANF
jgi:hypothetical protein